MRKWLLCTAVLSSLVRVVHGSQVYNLTVLSTDPTFQAIAANDQGEFIGITLGTDGSQSPTNPPAYFRDGTIAKLQVPATGSYPFVTSLNSQGDISVVEQLPMSSYLYT